MHVLSYSGICTKVAMAITLLPSEVVIASSLLVCVSGWGPASNSKQTVLVLILLTENIHCIADRIKRICPRDFRMFYIRLIGLSHNLSNVSFPIECMSNLSLYSWSVRSLSIQNPRLFLYGPFVTTLLFSSGSSTVHVITVSWNEICPCHNLTELNIHFFVWNYDHLFDLWIQIPFWILYLG